MTFATDSQGGPVRPGTASYHDARRHLFSAEQSSGSPPFPPSDAASVPCSAEPFNPQEIANRAKKAQAIARWLHEAQWSPKEIGERDQEWWDEMAKQAGQRTPSTKTQALVLELLSRHRRHDIDYWQTDSDDFRSWVVAYCTCGEVFGATAGDGARSQILRSHAEHRQQQESGDAVQMCVDCGKERGFGFSSRFGELAPSDDRCGPCELVLERMESGT